MPVKFNIVERPNPQNLDAPRKYYPSVRASGRRTLRDLSKHISKICTIRSPDTLAVIEALLMVIPEELADGNIVELGEFGSFWLRNSAEGEAKPDNVSANQVTNLLPRFLPGKEFKKALKTVKLVKGS